VLALAQGRVNFHVVKQVSVPPAKPYQAALNEAAAALAAAGIDEPRREARLLLAHLLGLAPRALPPGDAMVDQVAFGAVVLRRAAHEPLAYITGTKAFWTFEVAVSPATLIPRPDSETLIEAALAAYPDRGAVRFVLDLGTGTGCLLLAALLEFPAAYGVGVDLVPSASRLAAGNAARLGLAGRAGFLAANWAAPLCARFDLILCNPPYVATGDLARLMPDVAHHEPASALDGGADGLTEYAQLIPGLLPLLNPGATAIFELGQGQADAAVALARRAGYAGIATRPDLAGIPRALVLHAPV
jgi:release factor glutamine methyltransferase